MTPYLEKELQKTYKEAMKKEIEEKKPDIPVLIILFILAWAIGLFVTKFIIHLF